MPAMSRGWRRVITCRSGRDPLLFAKTKRNTIVYILCKCENKASLISRYVRMATIGERQTTPFECRLASVFAYTSLRKCRNQCPAISNATKKLLERECNGSVPLILFCPNMTLTRQKVIQYRQPSPWCFHKQRLGAARSARCVRGTERQPTYHIPECKTS